MHRSRSTRPLLPIALVLGTLLLPAPPTRAQADAARDPDLERVGFYDRRERSWGHFFTRAEIERRAPEKASDLLYGIPGVRIRERRDGAEVRMRGATTLLGECAPSLVVDGTPVRPGGTADVRGARLDHVVALDHIRAMEVYVGAAGLPPRYRGVVSPCGAILIWTGR